MSLDHSLIPIKWNPSLRFVAFGDWGHSSPIRRTLLEQLRGQDLDFIILLGDNFYYDGVASVTDPQWEVVEEEFPPDVRLYPVLGNHDYHMDPFSQVFYSSRMGNKTWKMPFLYYDEMIPLGNDSVHFLFLDTCLLAPRMSMQLFDMCLIPISKRRDFLEMIDKFSQSQKIWIRDTLARSTSRWKIVCGHYPLFSNGSHVLSNELRQFLLPLFREYRVNLYFSGHDHNGQVILEQDTCFVVSGAIAEHQFPKEKRGFHHLFQSNCEGYFHCEVTHNSIHLDYIMKDGKQTRIISL